MSETRPAPERINLTRAEDPRDVVHRTVASLAQGDCVALGRSGVLTVVASALRPEAFGRMACLPHPSAPEPDDLTLLLRGVEEVSDWVPDLSVVGARLARRLWPGSVTVVAGWGGERGLTHRLPPALRGAFPADTGPPLQVPPDPFLREVLKLVPGPLVARVRVPAALLTDEALAACGCGLVVDTGSESLENAPTLVRVGPVGWEVLRAGVVDEAIVRRMAGTIVVFVCTGNTCRSPMAEGICKILLAERLGCAVKELESRGYVVISAGMAAIAGLPAAANAVDVLRARGGSLEGHLSRKLTPELVRRADHLVVMTGDHLDTLLDRVPEAASKTRLLHPAGGDVADPVGADRDTYQRTADAIESYLRHFLASLEL